MTGAKSVTRAGISLAGFNVDLTRADIEFQGVDHSGPSFDAHVFLNNPAADETTERRLETGYAGTFHIFGHGGCFGEAGHCDVHSRRLYDPRPDHPLTPARKVVIATEAVRRAMEQTETLSVTVVPIIRGVTVKTGWPEDVLRFDQVRVVSYR